VDADGTDRGDMAERVIDLDALYRAPVTLCSARGTGRYRTTLATRDRVVLDPADALASPAVEIGELVSLGCADPDGWVTGEVRVVAVRIEGSLVTTAPTLSVCQRRDAHRVRVTLPVEVALLDEPEELVRGRTVDVSAGGLAMQLPPLQVSAGDRLRLRIELPQGPDIEAHAEAVDSGPTTRVSFTRIGERARDRLVGYLARTEVRRGAGRAR
jgi:hypothetical protein